MNSQAIEQSIAYHRDHRIGESEAIQYGFRDAGRDTDFDEEGAPLMAPRREMLLVKSPEDDPVFGRAVEAARIATAGLNSFQVVDYLNDYVDRLLKKNDPSVNMKLLDRLAGASGAASVEISLGQLIEAKTGVCRHRSLLFKALADQLGLRSALVRGNYIRRGVDRTAAGGDDIGGHAWNEVLFENGERLLVDTMHNFVAELTDPLIASYSDVWNKPLYPMAGKPETSRDAANPIPSVRDTDWIWVTSPSGGRSAYAYLDALSESERRRLRRALKSHAIRYDRHKTSYGSSKGKRPVLRVRGVAQILLKRLGAEYSREAPEPLRAS